MLKKLEMMKKTMLSKPEMRTSKVSIIGSFNYDINLYVKWQAHGTNAYFMENC